MSTHSSKRSKSKAKTKKESTSKLIPLLLIVLGLVVLFSGTIYLYNVYYQNKIYPRVALAQTDIGGSTQEETKEMLAEKIKEINERGLAFVYQDERVGITPTIIAPQNPDASYEIINFNPEKTVTEVFKNGREGGLLKNIKEQFLALISGRQEAVDYTLNEEELVKILKENFTKYENPHQDAQLSVSENLSFGVSEEKTGEIFNYDEILKEVRNRLGNLLIEDISLVLSPDYPEIKKANSQKALAEAEEVKNLAPFNIVFEDKTFEVTPELFASWLALILPEEDRDNSKNNIALASDRMPVIGLGKAKIDSYLDTIGQDINIEAKEGKFRMEGEKVVEFQASEPGRQINKETTFETINKKILEGKEKKVELSIEEALPVITTENINDLGIKELIGRGESDYRGSPPNRIHNIKVGAETLNGILIKPNEEFSLVKALGEISAKTGYLPELVIKGNKTIPEYGGGLCQIGTTTFRVTLDAGLPITERQEHSYRVSYYEPAGTDATIYDPKPDFRFINDTGNYILFQARIEGTKVIFEFYGTKDGRQVEMTAPRIFNLVSPGPTKIVETEDLAPGQTKCTERAHTGADTEFTRKVTKANGEAVEEVWKSHYKPWQEVCLVGKNPTPPTPVPSNTNQNNNQNSNQNTNNSP